MHGGFNLDVASVLKAHTDPDWRDVRFGSQADLAAAIWMSALHPKADLGRHVATHFSDRGDWLDVVWVAPVACNWCLGAAIWG